MFPDYIIRKPPKPFFKVKQLGLYNLNCISTNSKHVCNMDSHFMDNINLPNSHPSILGHCYLFLVKNRVFGLLDRIAPKLPHKIRRRKKFKDHDSPNLLTGLRPSKSKIPSFRPIFHFFKIFHILRKIRKNLHFLVLFLLFYLTGF